MLNFQNSVLFQVTKKIMKNTATTVKISRTRQVTIVGVLSAISIILYFVEFPIAFLFPDFLKIDFTDLPALIGTLFFGPLVGIFIELIKNLFHFMTMARTGGVGEFANFIVGVAYILPVGLIYNKFKNTKGYVLGCIGGTISMIVIACIVNYFVLIPFYVKVSGMPLEFYVETAGKIIGAVNSYPKFIMISIGGFNLVKAVMLSILGYFVCLPLKKYL